MALGYEHSVVSRSVTDTLKLENEKGSRLAAPYSVARNDGLNLS
jgi:hypothetical protein